MKFEWHIAWRMASGIRKSGESAIMGTRPIIRLAVFSVALGTAVMIVSLAVLSGFKKEIREKVIGFGSHIQITAYSDEGSFDQKPIGRDQPFLKTLEGMEGIRHIQSFATKAGIIKKGEEMEGVILKGIGSDFNWNFFEKNLVEGRAFRIADSARSNDILISRYTARRLELSTGDDIAMFFIQDPPRVRKFRVSGIYETGLEDFDKLYALGDIAHIRKLNDWEERQIGGFEILVNNFDKLHELNQAVDEEAGYDMKAASIIDLYPQLFGWLELQDTNVAIIIILMLLVTGINMISALLILILERTRMIGVLKSLGATNTIIQNIFLIKGAFLIGTGILLGNATGLAICWLQHYFHFIHLDQASYYVSVVPVHIIPLHIALLNIGTFIICMAMLMGPSYLIARLSPVKALRFS